MYFSLFLIFILAISFGKLFEKIGLPKIIAMLAVGIVIGPFVLNIIDSSVLDISSQIRKAALIIILIKAGLSLNLSDLKKVGRPALLMSFLPASFEILAYTLLGPLIFHISYSESALMGAVLSAVSPAVVVPRMTSMIEQNCGTQKGIPQMILAGASLDDVFVITIFGALCTVVQGGSVGIKTFLSIPISILSGVLLGLIAGLILAKIVELLYKNKSSDIPLLATIVFALSLGFVALEDRLSAVVSISSMLAVCALAATIKNRAEKNSSVNVKSLSRLFGGVWVPAECLLFVLVGACVDIKYAASAGGKAVLIIFLSLIVRSIGVMISVAGCKFTLKEKLFCVVSYLPKATVQAAIGSVPLALGLDCGNVILSVAVLGILVTAPLGAFGIDAMKKRLFDNKMSVE